MVNNDEILSFLYINYFTTTTTTTSAIGRHILLPYRANHQHQAVEQFVVEQLTFLLWCGKKRFTYVEVKCKL